MSRSTFYVYFEDKAHLLSALTEEAVHELVETTRLFARTVASIEPRWLEEIGAHRLLATLTEDVAVITNGLVSIPTICLQGAVLVLHQRLPHVRPVALGPPR